jgi:hypothetical protein
MPIRGKRYPFVDYAIAGAPADPGVFALWEGEELIYIGAAQGDDMTLQAALASHLKGLCPCTKGTTHYSWQLTRNVKALEAQVLQEFHASFLRLPRCNGAA